MMHGTTKYLVTMIPMMIDALTEITYCVVVLLIAFVTSKSLAALMFPCSSINPAREDEGGVCPKTFIAGPHVGLTCGKYIGTTWFCP